MGRSETATASLGIKILLSDLVSQIDETNFDLIKKILKDGFIEDDNDMFNNTYIKIIYSIMDNNELKNNYVKCKEFLEEKFKITGTDWEERFTNKVLHTLDNGSLFNKELLFPIKDILSTARYGYERYGTNALSRPIDFDLSMDLEEYKDIKNYSVVFILNQLS